MTGEQTQCQLKDVRRSFRQYSVSTAWFSEQQLSLRPFRGLVKLTYSKCFPLRITVFVCTHAVHGGGQWKVCGGSWASIKLGWGGRRQSSALLAANAMLECEQRCFWNAVRLTSQFRRCNCLHVVVTELSYFMEGVEGGGRGGRERCFGNAV